MTPIILPGILTPGEAGLMGQYAQYSVHHDEDEGHGIESVKPNYVPSVATKAFARMSGLIPREFIEIDPWMKFYRLTPESPVIKQHQDKDFMCPSGLLATTSVLIFLETDFDGGATVFDGSITVHASAGMALVFPHALLHEALPVTRGTKLVLKTDLCVKPS